MCRRWSFGAASLLLAGALAHGAEITANRVDVEILADGSYRCVTHFELRLLTVGDVEAWSPFAIPLDENRTLESLGGTIAFPDGKTRGIKRADLDTAGEVDASLVASSATRRLIRLTGVPAGSTLTLDYATLTHPYYPTGGIWPLRWPAASTTRLEVTVRSARPRFRYHLSGDASGLTVKPAPDGVSVVGAGLAAIVLPADAPDLASAGPTLHFGWDREPSWEDVGRWWSGLLAATPPPGTRVAAACRDLALAGKTPADAVAAVLAFVHAHARYVAVELGIGGWKPIDAETTLDHGWGDCKGLALLSCAMLRQAGVAAIPAAVAVSAGSLVDTEFPSLDAFDHVVVAVPAAGAGPGGLLDESGAWALLDPTATAPGLDRFPAHLMGRDLLLLDGAHAGLIRASVVPERETRRLRVDLALAPDGSARGTAALELAGERAAWWIEASREEPAADVDRRGREMLSALLPSALLADFSWSRDDARAGVLVLRARISIPELLEVGQTSRWFRADGPSATPASSVLASRSVPLVRAPQLAETVWAVRLPEGWHLVPVAPVAIANRVASFTESVAVDGPVVRVLRRGELRRRCVAEDAMPLLREVSSAEHRAERRRLLIEASGAGSPKRGQ